MRANWKGSISFGLVHIPVKVCGAVEANQIVFHQVHQACKNRIRYQKYCPYCEKVVPDYEIIKGYQTPDGIIPVTGQDLAEVDLPSLKTIELAGFIKEKGVDPLFYQKPYYLFPDNSEQPYWLLYHALKKSGKVGIARFAVHSREHLALIRPAKGVLALCTLYYPEEIREVEGVSPKKPEVQHMDLALGLIEQQTVDFKPELYKDRYRESLEKMLEKKMPEVQSASPPQITDLVEALRLSIEKAKDKKRTA
ncbi:MAG: Ku protein [Bacillota bacterium]|nr:Ku protein [Bacillota bacterium]